MKSNLTNEIAKTVRALEQFATDWEKQFPENGSKAFLATARRLSAVLMLAPELATTGGSNGAKQESGHQRVRERRATVNKW